MWSRLILVTTGVRVSIEGLDRVAPGTTYIFVSNHQSIYYIPVIFASLPFQLRIIAKASLAKASRSCASVCGHSWLRWGIVRRFAGVR